jgi:hypothetical protein
LQVFEESAMKLTALIPFFDHLFVASTTSSEKGCIT